jgi:hypothetical protein
MTISSIRTSKFTAVATAVAFLSSAGAFADQSVNCEAPCQAGAQAAYNSVISSIPAAQAQCNQLIFYEQAACNTSLQRI